MVVAQASGVYVVVAAIGLASAACSGDVSGCENFKPTSAPSADGDEIAVELEIVGGAWATPDIAANYWDADVPVPQAVRSPATLSGVAVLVESERIHDGQLLSGVVRVNLGEHGIVEFEGPIGCA